MSCKHPTLNDNLSLIPTRGLIYVANLLNVFHITTLFNKNNLPNKKHPKNHQKIIPQNPSKNTISPPKITLLDCRVIGIKKAISCECETAFILVDFFVNARREHIN